MEAQRNPVVAVIPGSSKSPMSSADAVSATMEEAAPTMSTQMLPTEPFLSSDMDLVDEVADSRWSEIRGARQATTVPETTSDHGRLSVGQPTKPYGTDLQGKSFLQVAPRKLDGIELASGSVRGLFEK